MRKFEGINTVLPYVIYILDWTKRYLSCLLLLFTCRQVKIHVLALLLNRSRPFVQLQTSLPDAAADPAQGQSGRHHGHGHDGLKHQRPVHVKGGICVLTRLERVADHDEDATEELPPRPVYRAAGLGLYGKRHLDQPLERDRQEAETGRSEHAEDDVRGCEAVGRRRPDEGEVGQRYYGSDRLDKREVGLGPIDQRGADGSRNEADENQKRAADAGFAVGETVGRKNLGEKGGGRIEETDVGGKGEKKKVEGRVGREEAESLSDRGARMHRGGR